MTIFKHLKISIIIFILIVISFLFIHELFIPFYLKHKHRYTQEVKINNWLGKVLHVPMIESTLKISHYNPGNNIKLVSYINGNCSVCIGDFDKWRPILNEIKSFQNTEILFYVYSINFNELIKNIERRDQFPITLINDNENLFFRTNHLDENKMFHTFLLDSKNQVLLVGNPLLNSELQDLYIKTIKNLTEQR